MATVASPSIGAPPGFGDDWDAIEWRKVFREVRRLQMRIAKAVRDKRYGRAEGPAVASHPQLPGEAVGGDRTTGSG